MVGKLAIILLLSLHSFILSCKSKAPKQEELACPAGFQKVPKGFKCNGADNIDCANEQNVLIRHHIFVMASLASEKRPQSQEMTD